MPDYHVLTVSQLNRYVKSVIDGDINLQTIFIQGEISGFVSHRNGHFYFKLKDESSVLNSVMFRTANSRLRFLPENGMKVVCKGRLSVYDAGGQYQLYVDDMRPDGAGELAVAFEQLKRRLEAEGLFSAEHKKKIPQYPQRVGVVTSRDGAAVRDIINVLSRRFPLVEMVFVPAAVQGPNAAPEIVNALRALNTEKACDVIIVGRGGGSAEDLWAFNEEIVAKAVHESEIPVISAVGHETDYTICDFVSDLRAPTPSAAAELAVPDVNSEYSRIRELSDTITGCVRNNILYGKHSVDVLLSSLEKNSPTSYINDLRVRCDRTITSIESSVTLSLEKEKLRVSVACKGLDTLSPLRILSRGYSVAMKDQHVVKSVCDISRGDGITLKFSDGTARCTVNERTINEQ